MADSVRVVYWQSADMTEPSAIKILNFSRTHRYAGRARTRAKPRYFTREILRVGERFPAD